MENKKASLALTLRLHRDRLQARTGAALTDEEAMLLTLTEMALMLAQEGEAQAAAVPAEAAAAAPEGLSAALGEWVVAMPSGYLGLAQFILMQDQKPAWTLSLQDAAEEMNRLRHTLEMVQGTRDEQDRRIEEMESEVKRGQEDYDRLRRAMSGYLDLWERCRAQGMKHQPGRSCAENIVDYIADLRWQLALKPAAVPPIEKEQSQAFYDIHQRCEQLGMAVSETKGRGEEVLDFIDNLVAERDRIKGALTKILSALAGVGKD